MKTDRKLKAAKTAPEIKTVNKSRRTASKAVSSNGKHPITSYEHIPIGIVESSLDGKYMDVNEEFCRITGYTRIALLRKGIRDLTDEEDYALDLKLYEQLVAGQIPFYRLEKRFVRKDGTSIWVELTRSLVRDAKQKPLHTIGVVLDISERKDVERVLRESAERLRLATGAAQMFMWEWDFQTQSYILADNFEQVLGFSADLLPKNKFETLWALSPREDIDRIAEGFEKAVENLSDLQSVPYRVINPENGQIVWLEISAKIIYDRAGKPERMFGVAQNITESKRTEEALRASETLYRTIARSIPGGGVYVVDRHFRYLVAEGPVTEAFGLSRERLEGHTVMEAFPDDRGKRMEERLRRNLAGETINYETKFGGRTYWTQQAPLLDALSHIIIVTIDITERKQAEEALRQSEERFAQFMQNLPGLAWIKDTQGRYVYANAAAEQAFGTQREKLYGRTDPEVFPPGVAAQFMKNDELALVNQKGMQTIETLKQEDGILHYSLVTKFPIPGPDGHAALIGGTAFDITERLQAEEALRESEERFRAILSQTTAGIVRKDPEGRFIFVNEAFCNMLGYTEADLLGKTIWEFMHQDDIGENKKSYDRLMMEGIPFKLERRFIRGDGSVIWVDASVSPIMDAEGRPQSAVAVEVDITGRKQAEEALQQLNLQLEDRVLSRTAKLREVNQTLRQEIADRMRAEEALRQSEAVAIENEQKLLTLFDLLPVGISFLSLEGQVIQMNTALPSILKLPKDKSVSEVSKSRKYIRADGMPMLPADFASARALAENRTVFNVETGVVLEGGETVWTSVSAAPVEVKDVGVVVVTVDITESKRAERALQESRERLQILSQRLVEVQEDERRALARELHDRVGQTLAALNINLIIVNGQLSAESREKIGERMNDSMKLVAETIALVRDVMTDLRPAVLDDYGLEAALESHVNQYTARYDIKTIFEKPSQPIPRLGASVEMTFLRIAQEALINIAKHAQADQVNLSLRQEGDAIRLTIQDNGTGIQSWQNANRPGSHGLTIMRERAEAFGGNLKVRSVSGKGTTVEVAIQFQSRHDKNEGEKEKQL